MIAARSIAIRVTRPNTASLCLRNRRQMTTSWLGSAGASCSAPPIPMVSVVFVAIGNYPPSPLGVADARVSDRVEHIRQHIRYNHKDRGNDQDAHNQRPVIVQGAEVEPSHTRIGEHRFGDDR